MQCSIVKELLACTALLPCTWHWYGFVLAVQYAFDVDEYNGIDMLLSSHADEQPTVLSRLSIVSIKSVQVCCQNGI